MNRVSTDEQISTAETVSAAFVTGLIKSATACDLVLERTLAELDFGELALASPLARIPYAQLVSLLDMLTRLTVERRELGVEIGGRLMPGCFSALGYAAVSGETLEEAIDTISRYEKVALTTGRTELVIADDTAHLYWSTTHNIAPYLLEEIILSAWVQLARSITDLQQLPIKVMFTGSVPKNLAPFTALFGSDILFCQPKACVLFPASLLKTPISHSDPFINNLMREQATNIHQALNVDAPLTVRVTEQIRDRLVCGDFGQESVASELCLSVRTLRRRLKTEGASYQTLLDDARRDLSRDYLSDKTLSIYEVAMQLGYSEHSAFSAAFKRWFGLSPQAFREQGIAPLIIASPTSIDTVIDQNCPR